MTHTAPKLFVTTLTRSRPCFILFSLLTLQKQRKNGNFLQHLKYATGVTQEEENKAAVEDLAKLCVDVNKIRRVKPWLLFRKMMYVKETAKILQEIGADETSVAHIFECYPEAILCCPRDISCQRDLWLSVCKNEKQLVELIKRFPDPFFTVEHYENQKANVRFFKDLGLKNIVISRLLISASNIFHNPVAKNKDMIETLHSSYLRLGGSQENMKKWLLKLLCQNPFILLNTTSSVKENLDFLQKNKFTDSEVLSLMSKLKGFIIQLNPSTMQNSLFFSKNIFKCTDQELKELIIKCPALLYYSVPVLEKRIEELLKVGISIDQIKDTPAVLELSAEIVQYRIKKLDSIGFHLKSGTLEYLSGTKKEFEATYGKVQEKKERPLFNPVAPLNVED
nr:transcription termination factor 2, mitochondrial [Pogona vitticeps]XP_020659305.1 transcription termination factor 2, mitochondrial [Pogona vitticeps]XP_020659306.1 transcription termination factor 2, mitochondrial [Pogona vitticeps]XP_020659307.1 transcription termination factor 2, mitochondrial [Pogona vitticeps]XP_020659308.1 transcription termination factor 2, mitochondrial [Pogona vitticeps]